MTESLDIHRFGSTEAQTCKSGESRLSQYLQRLKQTDSNNQGSHTNSSYSTNKKPSILKRKFANAFEHKAKSVPLSPNKKVKFAADTNVSHSANIELSIEENTTQQIIASNASFESSAAPDVVIEEPTHESIEKRDTNKDKTKHNKGHKKHHPIYDITTFPEIQLPEVANPEKTLMPQPVWMKKGNKIISDIGDHTEESKESLDVLRLDSRLRDALKAEGYKCYFPVQMNVIPAVVRGMVQKRDIAVCAPTGSGKTLAYVLPICHILCKELSDTSRTLRALVVSPTRDLAVQLFIVFERFAHCVGLKVGLSAGQQSFKDEQTMISTDNESNSGKSAIDVLICTPGRLVDHLNHTSGFSLKCLQFLVLDEADRLLLEGSYQDWLFRVYHILDSQRMMDKMQHEKKSASNISWVKYKNKICLTSRKASAYEYKPYLLKILLSATLTHNPKIISSLRLNNPLYFGSLTDKEYLIPSSIQQQFISCYNPEHALLNFIAVLDCLRQSKQSAVVFCDTVEIVHRLKRMVEIVFNGVHNLESFKVCEFSRMVSDRQRPHLLRQFRAKKIDFLICSDAMSRGLDIPELDCVINYECVRNVESYVHRIGRTARGVGCGTAITVMRSKDKRVLLEMLECVENGDKLTKYEMNMKVLRFHRKYMDQYTDLLHKLLSEEQNGDLDHDDSIYCSSVFESDSEMKK